MQHALVSFGGSAFSTFKNSWKVICQFHIKPQETTAERAVINKLNYVCLSEIRVQVPTQGWCYRRLSWFPTQVLKLRNPRTGSE